MAPRDVKVTIRFSSAAEAVAFADGVAEKSEGPGFGIRRRSDEFTSENEVVEIIIKFLEHGGPQAVAAVATFLTEVVRRWPRKDDKTPAPRMTVGSQTEALGEDAETVAERLLAPER